MRIRKPPAISLHFSIVVIIATVALLPACSVNVKDHGDDGNTKVDINTPLGGIHVDQNVDAATPASPSIPAPGRNQKPATATRRARTSTCPRSDLV